VIGVYEAHEAIVDFRKLVVVESGGEIGSFGEGERFVAENGERPTDVSSCKGCWIEEFVYLSVT
jgi:hypothetical protein